MDDGSKFAGGARLMRCIRRGTASIAVLASLTACGSAASTVSDEIPGELIDRLDSHCTDLNDPALGEGDLCVDNGFRVESDDFAFANWGRSPSADDNVTVQTLIDLFGHAAVCAPGTTDECVVRPSALQKLDEWNNALSGGRCEGLAALSARMHLGIDNPSSFRSGAARVADLRRGDGDLEPSIVYWWATQFLREVGDRAAASRERSPLALVDDLIIGLANDVGYTLGLYSGSSGHSLTPFAVTRRGASFVVHVYDNNFPGQRREVAVSTATNTWSYEGATVGTDGRPVDWEGGTGSFELTPMSARQGPFDCDFCTVSSSTEGGPTVVSLASRDPASPGYIRIVNRSGEVLEATPETVVNGIPGATYHVGKGATGGVATVRIPASVGDVDVEVLRASDTVDAGDVVLTVRRPGSPTVQVSGNLADDAVGAPSPGVLLRIRTDSTTVTAPAERIARVSFASGSRLSRATLESGEQLLVSRISRDSVEVSWKGSDGSELGSASVDATGSDDSMLVTLSPDHVTGKLGAISAKVNAVRVRSRISGSTSTTAAATRPPRQTTTTVPSIELNLPD